MGLRWPKHVLRGNPIKRLGNAYVQGYKTYLTGTTNKKQQNKRIEVGLTAAAAYVTLGGSYAAQKGAEAYAQRNNTRTNPSPGELPQNPTDTYNDAPPDAITSVYGGNPNTSAPARSQALYQQQQNKKKNAAAGGLLVVGALGLALLAAMVKK